MSASYTLTFFPVSISCRGHGPWRGEGGLHDAHVANPGANPGAREWKWKSFGGKESSGKDGDEVMVEVVVEEEEEEVLVTTKKEVGLPNHVCAYIYVYIHVSGVKGKMSHGKVIREDGICLPKQRAMTWIK